MFGRRGAGNCILLIVAGHETTALSIGNSVGTLLSNPAQLERLRNDLSLLPRAVEECLRFEGPVGAVGRVVDRRSRTVENN